MPELILYPASGRPRVQSYNHSGCLNAERLLFAIVTRSLTARSDPRLKNNVLLPTAVSFEEFLMEENRELMELNQHLTDAEITEAIRYLDPDLCGEKAGEDTGTLVGIGITLLTALTGALIYIGLYVRKL